MINPKILEPDYADQFFDNGPSAGGALSEYEHGRLAGAFAERERIKSLIDLPEAQADLKTAVDFALSLGATTEGLRAALAKTTSEAGDANDERWKTIIEKLNSKVEQ